MYLLYYIFQVLLEAKADVKQALQDPRHNFNNLPQRWISYQQQQDQKDQLVHLLQVCYMSLTS